MCLNYRITENGKTRLDKRLLKKLLQCTQHIKISDKEFFIVMNDIHFRTNENALHENKLTLTQTLYNIRN